MKVLHEEPRTLHTGVFNTPVFVLDKPIWTFEIRIKKFGWEPDDTVHGAVFLQPPGKDYWLDGGSTHDNGVRPNDASAQQKFEKFFDDGRKVPAFEIPAGTKIRGRVMFSRPLEAMIVLSVE